jgi:surface protein
MLARILLLVVLFVCGSEATPFANKYDLKTAVDNCLDLVDNTGVACCGDSGCGDPSTALCGAAGCDEMPLWDTSSVTDMRQMFYQASAFNADISGWDTSSVTNMRYMFYQASAFNADISGWDTSSVTYMEGMFRDASAWLASYARSGGTISTDGPPNMWYRVSPWPPPPPEATQFASLQALKDDVNVCELQLGWNDISCDASKWDVRLLTSLNWAFDGASEFNADISGWNTSSVTDMGSMFRGASAFNADISGWDTSSVMYMDYMFVGASAFNADISGWDTSSVTYMGSMFEGASAWLDAYARTDGLSSTNGPPSEWYRVSPPCTCCQEKMKKMGLNIGGECTVQT